MKIIKKDKAKRFENSSSCAGVEYRLGDKEIDGAVVNINGRYPDKDRVVNLKCKELAYVLGGEGRIIIESNEIKLEKGDLVLIEPGEKYYWNGNLEMFISCTPAWYPEQHQETK